MKNRKWRDYDDGFDEDTLHDDEYPAANWLRQAKAESRRMRARLPNPDRGIDRARPPRKPPRHKSWQTPL